MTLREELTKLIDERVAALDCADEDKEPYRKVALQIVDLMEQADDSGVFDRTRREGLTEKVLAEVFLESLEHVACARITEEQSASVH